MTGSEQPTKLPNPLWRLVILLAVAVVGVYVGTTVAQRTKPPPSAAATDKPAQCRLSPNNTPAKRNDVWRLWNARGDGVMPHTPEAAIGAMLAIMLYPEAQQDEELQQELQNKGLELYQAKYVPVLSEDELTEIDLLLRKGPPLERARALRKMLAADVAAAELAQGILADEERIKLFLADKPIPLEPVTADPDPAPDDAAPIINPLDR
jgi:hypothetical protein